MKLAPLQLIDYHAHQLSVNANEHYKSDSNHISTGSIVVKHEIEQLQLPDVPEEEASTCQVELNIS